MNDSRRAPRHDADISIEEEFRQLVVWKKAQDLAHAISESIEGLPRNRATEAIAGQLMSAAGAVAASIAEGYGRDSQVAFREHLGRARGSAFEVESWLDLLVRRHDLSEASANRLLAGCKDVQRLIAEKMKSLDVLKSFAAPEEKG